jgi:hypothetical protein
LRRPRELQGHDPRLERAGRIDENVAMRVGLAIADDAGCGLVEALASWGLDQQLIGAPCAAAAASTGRARSSTTAADRSNGD